MSILGIAGIILMVVGFSVSLVGCMVLIGKYLESIDAEKPGLIEILVSFDITAITFPIELLKHWSWKSNRNETLTFAVGLLTITSGIIMLRLSP